MKLQKKNVKRNVLKIAALGLCFLPFSAFATFSTSCSHVLQESPSRFDTTKINVKNTEFIIKNSDDIKFMDSVDEVWRNINFFKRKILTKNILNNVDTEFNDICIPYSSINILDRKIKQITLRVFFKRFNYDSEQKIIPNTRFPQIENFNGKEYRTSIPLTSWHELLEKKDDHDYIKNFIMKEALLENVPSTTNTKDFEIQSISAVASDTIIIKFRLKSVYSSNGLSYEDFTLNVDIKQSYNLNNSKEQSSSAARQNSSILKINNGNSNINSQRYWVEKNECSSVVTFIFSN